MTWNILTIFFLAAVFFAPTLVGRISAQTPTFDPSVPAGQMQKLFDTMASQAGPLAPMFGNLTPEQQKKLDAVKISAAEEKQFGQEILDAFLLKCRREKTRVTLRGADIIYVRKLLEELKKNMTNADRYDLLTVCLVESPIENAYSIPGGHVIVTEKLLQNAGSEAALAGVLAHELSHLDRGHQLLPLKQAKLADQPLNFADSMMLLSLVARPFRPEQESEADADAVQSMMKSGYEPKELVRLLSRWASQQESTAPWQKFVPGFVKSHPDPGKRALAVAEEAKKLQDKYPNANYIGAENLRRRISFKEKKIKQE